MTDIRIKDIHVFSELKEAMAQLEMQTSPVVSTTEECLREFHRDLEIDLKESLTQLRELQSSAQEAASGDDLDKASQAHNFGEEISRLNQKIQELKSSIGTTEHLLIRSGSLARKIADMTQSTAKAHIALQTFEQISLRYLKLSSLNTQGSANTGNGSHTTFNSGQLMLVGDTFHFSKQNSISTIDIQRMENNIKSGNRNGNKLSIDGVSQSDFTMLENNGFTIQKIGPNDYSAFKTIER